MLLTEDCLVGVRYPRFLLLKISEFLYLLVKTERNKVLNMFSVSFVTGSLAPFSSGATVFQIFL